MLYPLYPLARRIMDEWEDLIQLIVASLKYICWLFTVYEEGRIRTTAFKTL